MYWLDGTEQGRYKYLSRSHLCCILPGGQLSQGTHIISQKTTCELVDAAVQNMSQVKVIQKWDDQSENLIECGSDRDTHAGYHGWVGEELVVSRE